MRLFFVLNVKKSLQQSKLQLDQSKMAMDLIFSFVPSLKGILDFDLKDPDSFKKKAEDIKKFAEKVKDLNKPRDNNPNNHK